MAVLTSPCVGVCRLDDATGLCVGCARTGDEIANWSAWDADRRRAVWDDLAARRTEGGFGHPALDLSGPEVARMLADRLAAATGTWTVGTYGALAAFAADDGPAARRATPGATVLLGPGGALRVRPGKNRLRAFAADPQAGPVTFALFREKLPPRPPAAVREIGPDRDPLDPADRDEVLFDLGLGRRHMTFGVRTGDGRLIDRLRAAEGRSLLADGSLWEALVAASPRRVVESPIARIEVRRAIPPRDGAPPDGPHGHLMPDLLALGLDQDPALGLPETYLGVLTHCP